MGHDARHDYGEMKGRWGTESSRAHPFSGSVATSVGYTVSEGICRAGNESYHKSGIQFCRKGRRRGKGTEWGYIREGEEWQKRREKMERKCYAVNEPASENEHRHLWEGIPKKETTLDAHSGRQAPREKKMRSRAQKPTTTHDRRMRISSYDDRPVAALN
ncbi:hypothetical protein K438DRAFT_1749469 [Mycena galopus ATCC 62051]|nr:hypothetical protein K438DRAFT_1749469 [Mycena galopus ATCC 62051]